MTLPATMRAALVPLDATGALELADVPVPVLRPGEILVRTHAIGVNRADLLQRAGKYRQPALVRDTARTIAGMEVAGTVVARAADVTTVEPGTRVMAMCGAAYAELVAVDAALALPVPDALDDCAAAALPVGLMTAYDALARAGSLRRGERVLVTAGASAVGAVAIQVAQVLGAECVLGTSRSDAGRDAISAARGVPVDPAPDALAKAVRDATGDGVDVVIDHVGGATAEAVFGCVRPSARIVSVGRLGGRSAVVDLNELARLRLSLVGATFRTRELDEYREIAAGVRTSLMVATSAGAVAAAVSEVFALSDADRALDLVAAGRAPGKVVITPS